MRNVIKAALILTTLFIFLASVIYANAFANTLPNLATTVLVTNQTKEMLCSQAVVFGYFSHTWSAPIMIKPDKMRKFDICGLPGAVWKKCYS